MSKISAQILGDYRDGKNYEQIAIKFGLTRERIRQLIKKEIIFQIQKGEMLMGGTSIECLDLSEKAMSVLTRNGIFSVEQLRGWTPDMLLTLSGMGKKKLQEIRSKLATNGFNLPDIIKDRGEAYLDTKGGSLPNEIRPYQKPREVSKEEFNTFLRQLKRVNRKKIIELNKGDEGQFLKMAQNYDSLEKFLKEIHISKAKLQAYYPETFCILNKKSEELKKRWSKFYIKCNSCGTTLIPHAGYGLCGKCYTKSDQWKATQKESRMRHLVKRQQYSKEYLSDYYKRPQVRDRIRKKGDIRDFGGNRELAIKRDGERCVSCRMTREESWRSLNKDLYVSRLDGNRMNNELSNLTTLCRNCFSRERFKIMRRGETEP